MFANDLKRNFVIGLFAYANCVSKLTLSGAVIWNVSRRTCAKSPSLSLSKRAITLGERHASCCGKREEEARSAAS